MSTPAPPEDEFAERMRALGELIEELERSCPTSALEPARELMRAVLGVQESGLRVLVAALEANGGAAALRAACTSSSAAGLLLMHGVHPESLKQRAQRAIDEVNAAAAPGARAELLAVEDERVRARVHVTNGHAAAGASLRRTLDAKLCELAPDAEITLTGGEPVQQEALVPASRLLARVGGVGR